MFSCTDCMYMVGLRLQCRSSDPKSHCCVTLLYYLHHSFPERNRQNNPPWKLVLSKYKEFSPKFFTLGFKKSNIMEYLWNALVLSSLSFLNPSRTCVVYISTLILTHVHSFQIFHIFLIPKCQTVGIESGGR